MICIHCSRKGAAPFEIPGRHQHGWRQTFGTTEPIDPPRHLKRGCWRGGSVVITSYQITSYHCAEGLPAISPRARPPLPKFAFSTRTGSKKARTKFTLFAPEVPTAHTVRGAVMCPLLFRPLAEGARRTADLFMIPFDQSAPSTCQGLLCFKTSAFNRP